MKRCRHENADHVLAGQFTMLSDGTIVDALVEQLRCLDCGAWLSLGPSNDAPAQVQVEIRAASLAASLTRLGAILAWQFNPHEWDEERRGWSMAETNMQQHTNAWHAGYLARVIATHTEGE